MGIDTVSLQTFATTTPRNDDVISLIGAGNVCQVKRCPDQGTDQNANNYTELMKKNNKGRSPGFRINVKNYLALAHMIRIN